MHEPSCDTSTRCASAPAHLPRSAPFASPDGEPKVSPARCFGRAAYLLRRLPVRVKGAFALAALLALAFAVGFALRGNVDTYEYRLSGPGGVSYKVREEAFFNADGYLERTEMTIGVPGEEAGRWVLARLSDDFGDLVIESRVHGETVTLSVAASTDSITRETHRALMSETLAGFQEG